MNEIENKWTQVAASLLEGATVISVRYMTEAEMNDLMWYQRCIVLLMRAKDGTIFNLFPSCDDEGNNAGAIFTDNEKTPVIPILR